MSNKKYTSPLTASLTPANWKEVIKLDAMSLNDMVDLMGDARQMAKLGKIIDGHMKEAIIARMPEGQEEYETDYWAIGITHGERAGGLDRDRILEEMGEDWVIDHSKDASEFVTITCKPVEKG